MPGHPPRALSLSHEFLFPEILFFYSPFFFSLRREKRDEDMKENKRGRVGCWSDGANESQAALAAAAAAQNCFAHSRTNRALSEWDGRPSDFENSSSSFCYSLIFLYPPQGSNSLDQRRKKKKKKKKKSKTSLVILRSESEQLRSLQEKVHCFFFVFFFLSVYIRGRVSVFCPGALDAVSSRIVYRFTASKRRKSSLSSSPSSFFTFTCSYGSLVLCIYLFMNDVCSSSSSSFTHFCWSIVDLARRFYDETFHRTNDGVISIIIKALDFARTSVESFFFLFLCRPFVCWCLMKRAKMMMDCVCLIFQIAFSIHLISMAFAICQRVQHFELNHFVC